MALYRHADYSVCMLREYFQNGRAGLDREMAEFLADHLHATVGRVIERAKEIDNEYAPPADSSWRRPRTERDSQGAASLQPRDLQTLLKERPRAADPIVEITGLVVRGVGQSQQRTVSVKLNDESAPATQLPKGPSHARYLPPCSDCRACCARTTEGTSYSQPTNRPRGKLTPRQSLRARSLRNGSLTTGRTRFVCYD